MNKRGQFYLITAMIIVAVIAGFLSIHNMARSKSPVDVSHIAEGLEIESEKVLDYHLYTGNSILEKFTKNYSEYIGDEARVVYVLENETDDLEAYRHNSTGDKILYDTYDLSYDSSTGVGKINVEVNFTNYTFDMREGKDFYFIVTKDISGEKHVITNQK